MNRFKQNQRIILLVALLVLLGFGMIVAILGQVWWTLSDVRNERRLVVAQEKPLKEFSRLFDAFLSNIGREVEARLIPSSRLSQRPLVSEDLFTSFESDIGQAWRQMKEDAREDGDNLRKVKGLLQALPQELTPLRNLMGRIQSWRVRHDVIAEDLNHQLTFKEVRRVTKKLREFIDTMEGRRRLQEAITLRQWRKADGEASKELAFQIVQSQTSSSYRSIKNTKLELADLASLVEQLVGEGGIGNLIDWKDNRFKPFLCADCPFYRRPGKPGSGGGHV